MTGAKNFFFGEIRGILDAVRVPRNLTQIADRP
jgi:hypothetical protein